MKRANGAVSNQRQLAAMLLSLLLPRHHTSLLATSPVSGPAAACCSDTEICSRKNKYLQVQTDNSTAGFYTRGVTGISEVFTIFREGIFFLLGPERP